MSLLQRPRIAGNEDRYPIWGVATARPGGVDSPARQTPIDGTFFPHASASAPSQNILERDDTSSISPQTLSDISSAAVRLAALGPLLARLAADMERQAADQEQRTAAIAATMDGLTASLGSAVLQLRSASGQMTEALGTVSHIADHTRIISINASIEAARAGEHGRCFGVVVEEVQRLADRTGVTAHRIEDHIREMQTSIRRVEAVSGSELAPSTTQAQADSALQGTGATISVQAINGQLHRMEASAKSQSEGAGQLHGLGDSVNALTEALLLAIGRCRFTLHRQAERAVASMLPSLETLLGQREACEVCLEDWLREQEAFELAYLTDAAGRQYVDNIVREGASLRRDHSALGSDWSERPWFKAACACEGLACTDLYRSTANKDYCFTVTAALRTVDGALRGVVAADVNFQRLIAHAT